MVDSKVTALLLGVVLGLVLENRWALFGKVAGFLRGLYDRFAK